MSTDQAAEADEAVIGHYLSLPQTAAVGLVVGGAVVSDIIAGPIGLALYAAGTVTTTVGHALCDSSSTTKIAPGT
jgi:hypothetical protein